MIPFSDLLRLVPDRVHARLFARLRRQGAPRPPDTKSAEAPSEAEWVVVQCESGADLERLHEQWVRQCHWHLQRVERPRSGTRGIGPVVTVSVRVSGSCGFLAVDVPQTHVQFDLSKFPPLLGFSG